MKPTDSKTEHRGNLMLRFRPIRPEEHGPGMPRILSFWLAVILVLSSSTASSAVELSGFISLKRERGEPVDNVEVFADGANPVTTGDDGRFVLIFRSGRPGQDVHVRVRRAGFEVVNDILLNNRLPASADARPLEIVMCPKAEREYWALEFYRLKVTEAVESGYRAKLEGRRAPTGEELNRFRLERDQALNQSLDWVQQLAKYGTDGAGAGHQDALRYFLAGNVELALALLSEEELTTRGQQAQQHLEQVTQRWLLRGRLLSTTLDFDGARRAYEKAVRIQPQSFSAWFEYAKFHQEINRFSLARRGYDEALRLARTGHDEMHVAITLNNRGILGALENRRDDARADYKEALELYRRLPTNESRISVRYVGGTLNNLGNLCASDGQQEEAREYFTEALDIFRSLAKSNFKVFAPELAGTLNNLGNLEATESETDRRARARQHFEEALQIYRDLESIGPQIFRPDIARTLNNLATLNTAETRYEEAHQQYDEALVIYHALAEMKPEVYRPYLATTLKNLGNLSASEKRFPEARLHFTEALGVCHELARNERATYDAQIRMLEQTLRSLPR